MYPKKEKICPVYVPKHSSNCEKQVIVLMIPKGEGWRYLSVIKLSPLLRRIGSKHDGDFYSLDCLHSFATKNKSESHRKVCENKYFYNFVMPSEDTKILEFNLYQKSDIATFIIYGDL